jgi:two-component system, NtrC family, response regulator HydG
MPPHDPKAPRILVVDDEREMAEMVADGLRDRGYEAMVAVSSEEAMARLGEEGFDALVTDLRMPNVDGLALLAEARRVTPDLPVIVMTAYGAIDSAIESIRRGASHYLTKPFKIEELALFIDRLLDERRAGVRASRLRG